MARRFDRLDRRETAIYREPNAPSKLIVPTLDLAEKLSRPGASTARHLATSLRSLRRVDRIPPVLPIRQSWGQSFWKP